jgi:glycosyltransferase involved in cell wall biosynthesis
MARILEISSYPPPRSGWSVRVEYLKRLLEANGHECIVLNIGSSRKQPSPDYETVLGPFDYIRKVVRFTRRGFTSHLHVNGASPKGVALALVAGLIGGCWGRRPFLTFHAGVEQVYFPRSRAPRWAPVFRLLFALPRTIICNSEAVKQRIAEYGVAPEKIVPIPAFSTQYLERRAVDLPAALAAFYGKCPRIVFSYTRLRPLFYPVEIIRGFAAVARTLPDVGLVLCGVSDHKEIALEAQVRAEIVAQDLSDRILVVDDLDHDTFLEALARASLYLRSHVSDGVCSSVLEALSLGVPVVASENGTRPPGVLTYPAADADALARVLIDALARREAIRPQLSRPVLTDTLGLEVRLLTTGTVGEAV